MQFHEYTNLKRRFLRTTDPGVAKQRLQSLTPCQFRGTITRELRGTKEAYGYQAEAEGVWVESERPFYNVWPIAVGLARNVQLNLPFSSVELPFERSIDCVGGVMRRTALLLRFARGHEPTGLETALLDWRLTGNEVHVHGFAGMEEELFFFGRYESSESVECWLEKLLAKPQRDGTKGEELETADPTTVERVAVLVRLVVFIALLAKDEDVITPIILSKDRKKYEDTDDADVKKWLEDRAIRRGSRGFDVGKRLQLEKEKSPHWRNPHLALFWTGPGRTKPIIKTRKGSLVQRVSMADVPTGYLGPETDEDDKIPDEKTPRESISKSRRFAIFKRDGNKCQLCGRSQDDGVKLHVDHRVPLAKGGPNEDDNLWTLCDDCNLGKSDSSL